MPCSATHRFRSLLVAAAGAALLAATAQAQAPAWDLATTGSLTQVNGTSQTRALTTDAGGSVYVTGSFSGSVAFGSTVLVSAGGSSDLFVAKYVPGTGTWAWAQRGGGTGADAGYGIAVNGSSVYVTGGLANNSADTNAARFGGTTPAASTVQVNGASATTSQDMVLAKYTDNGTSATLAWTQVGGGTSPFDQGTGVAVSGTSVYVTGLLYNNTGNTNAVLFGGGGTTAGTVVVQGASATASQDVLLVKYTDNGTSATLGWTQVGGGNFTDYGSGVAVSGSSVYVVGTLYNSVANANGVLFGGSGTTPGTVPVNGVSATAGPDLVLAKYQDNGSSATLVWTQVGGGFNADFGAGVAVSGASVYVTGTLANTTTNGSNVLFGGGGTTPGTSVVNGASTNSGGDVLLAKYTDNGATATFGWAQVGGGADADQGIGVAVSGTSVYVAGTLVNSITNANNVRFGGGGGAAGVVVPGVHTQETADLVLAKYTDNGATGTLNWVQASGGNGNDQATGVATRGGQVYAGGSVTVNTGTSSVLSFGPANAQAVQGTMGTRAVLAQVTDAGGSGLQTGLAAATNGGTSTLRAIATDASGNVLATGYFSGEVDFGSTRLSSAGGIDLFVAKYVPATGTWAWAQRGGGIGDDNGNSVAVQGSSVYVAGTLTNSRTNANAVTFGGTGPATSTAPVSGIASTNTPDLVLAKYTDQGTSATLGWTQTGGGTGDDRGGGVAASGSSVYLTGSITNNQVNGNTVVFGGSGTTSGTVVVNGASTALSEDLVLAKYTDQGTTATVGWTQVGGGTDGDQGNGVAVQGSSVYVTGTFINNMGNTRSVLFGGGGTTLGTVPVSGAAPFASQDVLLAKYQDNGATGTLAWTQVGGGIRDDQGIGVAVSGTSVYVTGFITNDTANSNSVVFGGSGTTAGTAPQAGATAVFGPDLVLAKYTDNGSTATVGWTQVSGGSGGDVGYAVAATSTSVYVVGTLLIGMASGAAAVFGGSGTTPGLVVVPGASATASYDVVLARYLDNGSSASLGWARVGSGSSDDIAFGLAVSGQAVYVSGTTPSETTYGPITLNLPSRGPSALLARVTDTGTLATRAAGPAGVGLTLYPNPAHGAATLTGATPGTLVQVLDVLGREVAIATTGADGTAALTGLAPGVYVVRAGTRATRLAVE